ncbi:DUF397 domain-containing protein [Streptomyces prunicolor]|uniref:DUF397 domain-containing protein n=1 Tax=Streptomyces prunicolor TaxID=67348 RepID=UPI00225C38F0|nr:DUF397 domain-containing protein [Streptomyces prunicolor]MCX5237522.1 DUF397 domain-containing protein [Streptomyces prunicolor]
MPETTWQKSSYSGSGDNNCVELAASDTTLTLRESNNPTAVLHTHHPQLAALLRHIKTTTPRH